ncbi:MAG TPA: response regulator transcription factor, partial [Kofleriaceae bacterium]|nr:response regulator transcription factor [Kofleriaceae bacterium]
LATDSDPCAIVLDINLPDISGFEVCRRLRASPTTADLPVLVLSARDSEVDRVVAFEVGADDFMGKPFSVREMTLRVEALLRRAHPAPVGPCSEARLARGELCLERDRRRCLVGEREVALSTTEFDLLRTLMERHGRVQTRERLLSDVWDASGQICLRTVDTHVKRLRQKLGDAGGLIRTVRGVGYCLDATPPG